MANREHAHFGTLLHHLRLAAGLTQEQLSARSGLSSDAISALESGKRRSPRFATVEQLASALGLDAQERHALVAAARGAAARGAAASAWGGTAPGAEATTGMVGTGRAGTAEYAGAVATSEGLSPAHGISRETARALPLHPRWPVGDPTPLVDRVGELDIILQRLQDEGVRLLTLTGPAGVGKTRLAQAAAAHLATTATGRFADGVVFVDLTPVRDPNLALGALARALGLLDVGRRPLLERVVDVLAQRRRLLVVLDNFEQVLPAAAQFAELLAASPDLTLLVTSRVPLQLRWEQTLRIAPLPVPDLREPLPSLEELLAVPSVALFVDRARARRADFVMTEKQAALVAQIVAQLDGLPLALELAAARLDVLSLPSLARRLGDRLRLLSTAAPDVPARQQSLEATIGWSYDLLTPAERRLFRCLGVFVGRVSLDAITAVVSAVSAVGAAGTEGPKGVDGESRTAPADRRTLPRLVSLAQKSLLLPIPARPQALGGPNGQPGYDGEAEEAADDDEEVELAFGMLETVRVYAEEQLAASGELDAARRAHAHYFLALAERADPELHGRDQRAWFFRLEHEQDNLRAALRWLLDGGGQDNHDGPDGPHATAVRGAGLRLAAALGWFWYTRGDHKEGVRWLEEALARAPTGEGGTGADPAARIRALVATGRMLIEQGDLTRARAVLEEGLALAERRQDPAAVADAHSFLALSAVTAGEAAEGMCLLREALRHWEAVGDPEGIGKAHYYLGYAADTTGDAATAAPSYSEALRWLGVAGDAHLAGYAHCYLGVADWKLGDLRRAIEHVRAGVQTSISLRDRWLLGFGAQATVALVGSRAEPGVQARLLGATDVLAQATGARFAWQRWPAGADAAGLRRQLAREQGEGELTVAYREGRALPFDAVVALILRLLDTLVQSLDQPQPETDAGLASTQLPILQSQHQVQSPLTAREQEVLRLVAQGLSSKAIGQQLFLSPHTVNHHLTAIFRKLGVTTRAEAVAVAVTRGLLLRVE